MEAPSLYVGTYAKYNAGSIAGEWVNLTDFSDYEDFISYCRDIHSDEQDAELMFQDYENIPSAMYDECGITEDEFNSIIEMYNHPDREAAFTYYDYFGEWDLRKFEDRFCGEWDTELDYAYHIVDECYNLDKELGSLAYYFDYDKFSRDLFAYDYLFLEGYVFTNY